MTALITGGSRGIGFACVKALLEKEYTVIAAARKESEAIAALKKEYPGRVFFFPCDISKQDQIRALVSFVEAEFGALQMLVNAAGVAPRVRKDILELTPDEMDEVLDVSDRILVMYDGEIVAELDPKLTNPEEMGLYMAGARRKDR